MKPPTPDSIICLVQGVRPIMEEMLTYCAFEAVNCNQVGSLSYNAKEDEITYYHKVTEDDRKLFDTLLGTDEIWIITGTGVES